MKLLLFTYEFPPQIGGIGKYCYELAKGIHKAGYEIIVLTSRCSTDNSIRLKSPFKILEIPILGINKLDIAIGCLYLIYFLLTCRPNHILVTHGTSVQIFSILVVLFYFTNKFSVILYGSDIIRETQAKYKKWLFYKLCKSCKNIFVISNFTKKLLMEKIDIPAEKVKILYAGINVDFFSAPPDREKISLLKKRLSISDQKVILTLARLDPRKGQDVVITSLPTVIRRIPNVKYVIAGSGYDEPRLRNLVKKYHLENYVVFAGQIGDEDVASFYDMCDIFVMLSRAEKDTVEGFGISFLEAAARSKPVIGGNHGGVPEVVIDGETGLLVNPCNVAEVANAITKLLSDDGLAEKLGKKGRERVFNYFTSETMAKNLLEALKLT